MKKSMVIVAMVLILVAMAHAAVYQAMTVSTTAIGITNAEAWAFSECVCGVESNNIRVRWDGTNPTSTVGMLLVSGTFITLKKTEIVPFRAIRVSADATLSCSCQ